MAEGRTATGACLGCGTLARSIHYPGCWITESVLLTSPARGAS